MNVEITANGKKIFDGVMDADSVKMLKVLAVLSDSSEVQGE